jgi:ABC-type nitrate/sulfonate/bicarbonate transport system substrate-binding protein
MTSRLKACLIHCAVIALAGLSATAAAAQQKTAAVRLGWQPLAGASAAINMVMIRDKLFEKAAERFGYKITAEWKPFTAGPPLNEAMLSGLLDIDMNLTALPTASRFASDIPAVPIAVTGSNIANAIMVKPGSAVDDVTKLAGKTIALPVGTAAHYVVASVVQTHFGKSIEEAGIKLINMPVTEAVKVPQGVDASAVWIPLRFMGPVQGLSETLVDANGWTGKGAAKPNVRLPEVEKAWGYPEGYITDRLSTFAHERFLSQHPDLAVAFVLGFIEAQDWVIKNQEAAIALANETWKQPDAVARQTLQTYAETVGVRQSPFVLEWDVASVVKASQFLVAAKIRDKALTWADLKTRFAKGASVQKRVWDASPDKFPVEAMRKGFDGKSETGVIRVNGGEPVWNRDSVPEWGERVLRK